MRRRFFIKIDEEIVTTITILRFLPLSLILIRLKSACVCQVMKILPRPYLQCLDIPHKTRDVLPSSCNIECFYSAFEQAEEFLLCEILLLKMPVCSAWRKWISHTAFSYLNIPSAFAVDTTA